jgi:hypothetical protein
MTAHTTGRARQEIKEAEPRLPSRKAQVLFRTHEGHLFSGVYNQKLFFYINPKDGRTVGIAPHYIAKWVFLADAFMFLENGTKAKVIPICD